jgi:curli biogenesis system outer membrane secretion channel CsgG
MKTLTATLLLCAGLTAAATVQAQQAQAPAAQYKRDLYGDWRVSYPAPTAKIAAELERSKADGQYTFGQEDYPPAIAATGPGESRAQVEQELQTAEMQGQMASDQESYPPMPMAHSGRSDIQ